MIPSFKYRQRRAPLQASFTFWKIGLIKNLNSQLDQRPNNNKSVRKKNNRLKVEKLQTKPNVLNTLWKNIYLSN